MKIKKILIASILLIVLFNINIVVKADSYCKYTNKTDCENHNKTDEGNLRCEWVSNTCRIKCSNYSENSCSGFQGLCSWDKSKKKCYYNEKEPDDKKVTVTPDNTKCEDRKTKDYCLKKGSCRWTDSKCVTQKSSREIEEEEEEEYSGGDSDSDINEQTYKNYDDDKVDCGGYDKGKAPLISGIPKSIPKVTHLLYLGIMIAIPVVLVIIGMLDLFKGLSAQKDDEIKKGQQTFVKRLLAAGIIFSVLMIVKLVIGFVADSRAPKIISCVECFIDNDCK